MTSRHPAAPVHRPPQAATVTWTLFSAVVGAGYASGQELVLFLAPCGRQGIPGALLVGMLIGMASLLQNPSASASQPGARDGCAAPMVAADLMHRGVALTLAWMTLAAMVAAMAHLVGQQDGQRAALLLAAGATWGGAALPVHRGLSPISRTLGPVMALAIITEAAAWAALPPARPPGTGLHPLAPGNPVHCLQGVFIYAAGNAVFARLAVERLVAAERLSPAHLVAACAAGGFLTGGVAAAALFAIGAAGTFDQPMPLMAAAGRLHPTVAVVHVAVVGAAAYTTAVAGAHALASAAAAALGGSRTKPLWAALVVASVLPAARGGFVETVHRLYPLGGWAALAALALSWVFARLGRRRLY